MLFLYTKSMAEPKFPKNHVSKGQFLARKQKWFFIKKQNRTRHVSAFKKRNNISRTQFIKRQNLLIPIVSCFTRKTVYKIRTNVRLSRLTFRALNSE